MASSFTASHSLLSISHPPSTSPSMPTNAAATLPISSSEHQRQVRQSEAQAQNTTGVSNSRKGGLRGGVDSPDWVASSLTRRFGLGAGLAWAGLLAAGAISEQVRTRLEVSRQEANTGDVEKDEEVVLPNGIRYYELRVGGGSTPIKGDIVAINLKGSVKGGMGGEFVDSFGEKKKPLALVMGSRPYTRGMCEGIEFVLKTMRVGGKRRVIVPPNLGFGEVGADFGNGVVVPPLATLEYIVEVEKVSLAPF